MSNAAAAKPHSAPATVRPDDRTTLDASKAILHLAGRQHGVVSRRQLIGIGLDPAMINGRLNAMRLISLYPGTYAVGHDRLTKRGWWTAAVLAGGRRAALSHRSAAALWGLLPDPHPVEILRSSSPDHPNSKLERWGRRPPLIIHRSRSLGPEEFVIHEGIKTTSVARTFLNLAPGSSISRLDSMITEAERRHILHIQELEEAASRGRGWPGSGKLRTALEDWDPHALETRTELELRFVAMCRQQGVPIPELNVWVEGNLVDGLWTNEGIVIELDSYAHHHSRRQFHRDREKSLTMEHAGFRVIRLTWAMVTRDAARTARLIKHRLLTSGQQ